MQLENGTSIEFNITEGMKLKLTVAVINRSFTGEEQIYVKQTVNVKGIGLLTSSAQQAFGLINPVFDNKSSALAYYNTTIYSNGQNIKITGDYVYSKSNFTQGQINSITSTEINWKTGWLEKISYISTYINGTVAIDYELQRESSNLINSIGNFTITTTELVSVLTIVAIPVLIGLSYKSFSKSSVKRQSNISYSNYLKSKLKYSKTKTKPKEFHSADHALDMIDEILKETKKE